MVAVQNRHFFVCYMQQRRNYVARRNKILVCINRNLEKRKDIFLKILDLLNLQASLQELVPKQRTRRFRRFCRNNKNWWKTVSQTYSQRRFKHTFRVSRTTFNFILSKIQHRIQKGYVTEEPIPPEQRHAICNLQLFIHNCRNGRFSRINSLSNSGWGLQSNSRGIMVRSSRAPFYQIRLRF